MNKKYGKSSQKFWDKEYKGAHHLALSTNPSEDLEKFTNWMEREFGKKYLNPIGSVLDLGCGNGRNLIYMAENYGMRGVGYDISQEAISQAKKLSANLNLIYEVKSIAEPIELADKSQNLVLDMMASHFLNKAERDFFYKEIARVLKPSGWFFFKTFILEDDDHAHRLLRDNPSGEEGTYIHPEIGVAEHVFTEDEINETFIEDFMIHKILMSHKHRAKGKASKRRSVSVYLQRNI